MRFIVRVKDTVFLQAGSGVREPSGKEKGVTFHHPRMESRVHSKLTVHTSDVKENGARSTYPAERTLYL